MVIATDILRRNFPASDESLPALVENIIRLMSGLGEVSTNPGEPAGGK
jgi:hypothetical protein